MVTVQLPRAKAKRSRSFSCLIGVVVLGLLLFVLKQNDVLTFVKAAAGDCKSRLDVMDKGFDRKRDKSRHARRTFMKTKKLSEAINQFDGYEPEAECYQKDSLGGGGKGYVSPGDGPKTVCGVNFLTNAQSCLVYKVGGHNTISFEKAVMERFLCETHTFDATLTTPYLGSEFSTFHPWALGKSGEFGMFHGEKIKLRSLTEIITELGHAGRKINILKIDCEGCEYTVMPKVFDAVAAGTLRIDQIQIEMHVAVDPAATARNIDIFFAAMDKAGYRVFHKGKIGAGCDGVGCVEYSLVHKTFLRNVNTDEVCLKDQDKVRGAK